MLDLESWNFFEEVLEGTIFLQIDCMQVVHELDTHSVTRYLYFSAFQAAVLV